MNFIISLYKLCFIVLLLHAIIDAGPTSVPAGGTDLSTLTAYAILCGGTTNTSALQQAGIGTSGQVLTSGGTSALPSFGTLAVVGGGTGLTTIASGATYYSSSASALTTLAIGTSNQVLTVASGAPAWTSYGSFPGYTGGTGFAFAGNTGTLAGSPTPTGTMIISTTSPASLTNSATNNTALGYNALNALTTGTQNTAIGSGALASCTTGVGNTAVGYYACNAVTYGNFNTALGYLALSLCATGSYNTACGTQALQNYTGSGATAIGYYALQQLTTGTGNSACGYAALASVTSGTNNTAVGYYALQQATGSNNTAVGYYAGSNLTTGSNNLYIGYYCRAISATDSGVTVIGTSTTTSSTHIYGITGVTISGALAMYVTTAGQLGITSSSKRFKKNIADVSEEQAEKLLDLNVVKFNYIKDTSGETNYGLIAEDVEDIMPEIMIYDGDGQAQTVQYHKLVPLLIKVLQDQKNKKTELKTEIDLLESSMATMQTQIVALENNYDDKE